MRPIDADALLELYDFPPDYAVALHVPIPVLVQNILDQPTLDYAPVIRCKDCMWWKTSGCWFHQPGKCVEREPNDFCSDGQRRSEDG